MGFFSGIGRIFRNIGYLLGFKTNKAADALGQNPGVIAGRYDEIVKDKRKRINEFKDAISGIVAQQETKKDKLKELTDDVGLYEKRKSGALALAKKVSEKYGNDQAKTQADPDFVKYQGLYKDYSTTLEEKNKRVKELEDDVNNFQGTITKYQSQIQSQMRELEKIAEEKNETIADVISDQEQKQIADVMSNISEDKTGQELQSLREMRQKSRASAKVSQTLAGLDTKGDEAACEAAAANSVHDDEFSKLMGFSTDKPAEAAPTDTKVAEH